MDVQRIDVGGAGAGRKHAVVLQPRILAERDVGIGIVERRVLALRHMMLDDRGARSRAGIDDDPRMGDVVGAVARSHVQNEQRRRHRPRDLEIQAVDEQRRVEQHPAALIGIRGGVEEAPQTARIVRRHSSYTIDFYAVYSGARSACNSG